MTTPLADYIRCHRQQIADDWERAVVAGLQELAELPRGALRDHMPEVLNGLAAWLEGKSEDAEETFEALAGGHAIQRLGYGIDLAVVSNEYATLRRAILQRLLTSANPVKVSGEEIVALNEGLDRAIEFAVRRYTDQREYLRERFIGIMAHDLRTPLNATTTAAALLLESNTLQEHDRKRVAVVARASDRMSRLIEAILDFARTHLGSGIPTNPLPGDMAEICKTAFAEAQAAHPGRSLELKVEGQLQGSFDRERALQALGNLLSNAIQHGTDPIVVRAWESDDQQMVFTSVANRGDPIPAAAMKRLFDPSAHAGHAREGHLGLGLFIVGQIASAHGGSCTAESSADGTVFTIRWPRAASRKRDRGQQAGLAQRG